MSNVPYRIWLLDDMPTATSSRPHVVSASSANVARYHNSLPSQNDSMEVQKRTSLKTKEERHLGIIVIHLRYLMPLVNSCTCFPIIQISQPPVLNSLVSYKLPVMFSLWSLVFFQLPNTCHKKEAYSSKNMHLLAMRRRREEMKKRGVWRWKMVCRLLTPHVSRHVCV